MKPEVKNAEGKETPQNEDNNVNSQKEKQNLVTEGQALAQALKDYENPSKTLTPKKEHHPFSWWLKWASSIILIFILKTFLRFSKYGKEGCLSMVVL